MAHDFPVGVSDARNFCSKKQIKLVKAEMISFLLVMFMLVQFLYFSNSLLILAQCEPVMQSHTHYKIYLGRRYEFCTSYRFRYNTNSFNLSIILQLYKSTTLLS